MTTCPNIGKACECQPQDGVMCPHGPTPNDWKSWEPAITCADREMSLETRPTDGEILSVLVGWYDIDADTALQWLDEFKPQAAYREYLQELGTCSKT